MSKLRNSGSAIKSGFAATRLRFGVIGSGAVGPILAKALAGAGHELVGITATGDDARERVQALLPGVKTLDAETLVRQSALVIFAVPGGEMPQLVRGLTKLNAWQQGQLLLHTAPELGHSVFNPALVCGVIGLALHPAMVFTGTSLDIARLKESRIVVTASAPVLPIAQALALEMGAEPVIIADADRPKYAEIMDAARHMSAAVVQQTVANLAKLGVNEPALLAGSTIVSSIAEALCVTAPENLDDLLDR
ncbi:NAD(P)-binding domain-containing protein [Canibacter sp. lx-72]|uniref:NAD(P)-binding domain-containing protein n=1 Tax=Canibacter zhuwentaonis TaxID=2837491 RepID=UPI001BDCE9F5|nr:NAD(P)-binding domain-containing protein [Canibacter zhuwentaonis]MBT1018355.1 NAD(P)-binding domain-containing protein [Canibacter zhuwentaonis]MBT1035543.1 NAD(P)-binding domain-containing protein [Canibacter zhuwentaonis]